MTLRQNIAIVTTQHSFTFLIKLDNVLNGRYLSLEDGIFVENVTADIQHFLRLGEEHKKSVLIFPPVNNYRRFLIHKVSEETTSKELSTFSIGQGFNRRTVVCLKGLVRKPSTINNSHDQTSQNLGDQTSGTMVVERQPISSDGSSPEHHCQNGSIKRVRAAPAIYRPPAARKLEALSAQVKQSHTITPTPPTVPVTPVASKTERTRSGTRQRRPDLQVYVPRAKRASMVDQNSTEQHIGHNEILSANHPIFGTKKNTPQLSLKFQNPPVDSNYDKTRHILSPTVLDADRNSEPSLKKMDIDEPVTKENHRRVVTKDSFDKESSPKCYLEGHVLRNDNDDSALSVGCETKDVHEVPNIKNCDMTNYESEEFHVSITSDSIGNGCDNGKCKERSFKNENVSDLSNDSQEVFISDSKQSGDGKCNNHKDHINKYSDEPNYFVEDSLDSISNPEKVSQPEISIRKNSISESKDQENLKSKNIIRRNLVSEVLVISDPEPSLELVHTVPKDKENTDKNNTITKKSKTKNKSGCSIAAGKAESNTSTAITTCTTSASTTTTTSVESLNPDECSWEMLFDDNGDCLDPKIMEELTNAVGSVTIEKPQSDYNRFITKPEINLPGGDDEFAHVVEIYNFPSEFKTQDLLLVFAPYKNGGFEIKWVDDTHALGVFSSSRVAADVLAYEHPFVKTRPLSEATPESRIKARRTAEFLQPYRARPETCVAMARRLVTGALGMRIATSREEREAERRLLKEAREKKKLAAQQQQDAWEGTIR